ncbi:MAG: shikimate dehydrogenase [Bifidobacteriaceae bacterium]|nr:shikimate dehydrogenase [Bifidobacteriaceae bacterium]
MGVKQAAVLGSPIGHSLSPLLHRAAYKALGLESWNYEAFEVTEVEFPDWFRQLGEGWAGLSLTMPLKRVVLEVVDHLDPLAAVTGAANTVLFTAGGTVAANTDVYGVVEAVRAAAPGRSFSDASAVVLGGGATAASALAALAQLEVKDVTVLVRSLARSRLLIEAAARMGVRPQFHKLGAGQLAGPWPSGSTQAADLVISTLPAGAADYLEPPAAADGVLLDVAYASWPSALANGWKAAGGILASPEEMLLQQAGEQVRLMTGLAAPMAAMRAALQDKRAE